MPNEGMSHDALTITSTAQIKKKSHHMKSSFAAQVSLWKKKFSQHALMKNVLASTFD